MDYAFTIEPNNDTQGPEFLMRKKRPGSKHSMVWAMTREDLNNLREALDLHLSCTCSQLKNGDPYRCGMHPDNVALTFDQRMDYERAHDARVRKQ